MAEDEFRPSTSFADEPNDCIADYNSRQKDGRRNYRFYILNDDEIEMIRGIAYSIGIDAYDEEKNYLIFNRHLRTAYFGNNNNDFIAIAGDILPDENSDHPTDLLSIKAVLAHEWYGHRPYRDTALPVSYWMDEYRASYVAAKTAPNLEYYERQQLLADAKAKHAGYTVNPDEFMRMCEEEEKIWNLKRQLYPEK